MYLCVCVCVCVWNVDSSSIFRYMYCPNVLTRNGKPERNPNIKITKMETPVIIPIATR